MGSVSFATLDEDFFVGVYTYVEFASYDGVLYNYVTTGAHHWAISGTGLTQTGGLLDGGTVAAASLDLGNDTTAEIAMSGLSAPGQNLSIGVGTGEEQNDRFWAALLGGDDTIDFTMADYSVGLAFNGDGVNIADGATHAGGDDSFNDGGTALSGQVFLAGDFYYVTNGMGVGGNDAFTVGAFTLLGDFSNVNFGASATGGDDTIAPARLVDNAFGYFLALGDGEFIDGALLGGDDLIDLSATNLAGFTGYTWLVGDAFFVGATGTAGGGDDTIRGSAGADSILGDWDGNFGAGVGGADSLEGDDGDDTILGNEGDDTIDGGYDADSLDGGAGWDVVVYSGASAGVSVSLASGVGTFDIAEGDSLTGFEAVNGSQHNDTLTGANGVANVLGASGGNDSVSGLSGTDTLSGGSGNDTLLGGTNSDSLTGGAGADSIVGGGGIDKVSYTKAPAGIAVNLATGKGTAGDAAGDRISDVDIVSGSNLGDTVVGGNFAEDLRGRGGSDSLSGGPGGDTLDGGSGNDTLTGGAGNDTLTGGGHKDRFDFSGSFGADVINLFNAGSGISDVIRFAGFGPAFDTFGEVLAATTDTGADCLINLGGGNTIILVGIDKTDLVSDDFSFA